jgi:hypothetical protein
MKESLKISYIVGMEMLLILETSQFIFNQITRLTQYISAQPFTVFFLSISLIVSPKVEAYLVMPSLNTFKSSNITNEQYRVDELHSDGVWFITANSDFSYNQYSNIFSTLGGRHVSEDNPTHSDSFDDYLTAMNAMPHASMCYNETGGTPGGTVLSDAQINQQYQTHGNKPILVMSRAYYGNWKTQVDRVLSNPKVAGVVLEYVKEALLESTDGIHNGAPNAIHAIVGAGKKCYLLLHAGQDEWSDLENQKIINKLNSWVPDEMGTDDVILVYQNYATETTPVLKTDEWFGESESVKSAIRQAKTMTNYTGNPVSFSFHNTTEGWNRSSSISGYGYTATGEYRLTVKPQSDPYISKRGLSIDSSRINRIRVRVKSGAAGNMQLFWGTSEYPGYSASRVATVNYPAANEWKELVFDLSEHPAWKGKTITALRFDSTSGSSTTYTYVDHIFGDSGYSYEFDGTDGWLTKGTSYAADSYYGRLRVRIAGGNNDPQVYRKNLFLDGDLHDEVVVRYWNNKAGHVQLFWGIEGSDHFSSSRVRTVYAPANQWLYLRFDMSNSSSWKGRKITSLRIDPPAVSASDTTKTVYIDWVRTH